MYKHSLFFKTPEEASRALDWLLLNFNGIEEYDSSYNGTVLFFYTAYALSERQQVIIVDTLEPESFLSEEL
jgi:hypothetical protein